MTTSGFGRALRFFIRQAEIYVLCIVAGGFLVAAYVWLINGYNVSFQEMLKTVPGSTVYIAMVILFISGMSSVQYWYSLPVSFGCMRKNVFWGNLVLDLLLIGEIAVFYFLTKDLFRVDTAQSETVFIFAAFFLLEGVSRFLGIAAAKWGKAIYVVMIIGVVGISMSAGFIVGYAGASGILVSVTDVLGGDILQNGQWIILAAGAVFCIAGNAANWRILRVFEVKA